MATTFRLVGRYARAEQAVDVEKELHAFFADHAEQQRRGHRRDRQTRVQRDLAAKYGLKWPVSFDCSTYETACSEGKLVFFSGYCNGLDTWLPDLMRASGAAEVEAPQDLPCASAVMSLDGVPRASELRDVVARLVETIADCRYGATPWAESWVHGHAAMFSNERTMAFHVPITSLDLSALERWLVGRGIKSPALRLCECSDEARFHAIGTARCLSCRGSLVYLCPETHPVDAEQLACGSCGGMFEISAFFAPPNVDAEARAREALLEQLSTLVATLEEKKLIELSRSSSSTQLALELAALDAKNEVALIKKIMEALLVSDFVEEVYATDAVLASEIRRVFEA
jgi:hypothetical protein